MDSFDFDSRDPDVVEASMVFLLAQKCFEQKEVDPRECTRYVYDRYPKWIDDPDLNKLKRAVFSKSPGYAERMDFDPWFEVALIIIEDVRRYRYEI